MKSPTQNNIVHEPNKKQEGNVTTECNEATFPSSGHLDSHQSLPSLGAHAQASFPSPPEPQQHVFFPPLPCAPSFEPPLRVSSLISLHALHPTPLGLVEAACRTP